MIIRQIHAPAKPVKHTEYRLKAFVGQNNLLTVMNNPFAVPNTCIV